MSPLLPLVTIAAALSGAAEAQDRSEAELRAIFESQLETFRSVREAPDHGASRGLVLAPGNAPAAAAVAVEPADVGAVGIDAVPGPAGGSPAAVPEIDAATIAPAPLEPAVVAPGALAAPGTAQSLELAAPAAEAPATPVTHWVLPEAQQVSMRVTFAFDSAAIAATEKPRLRQICSVIDDTGISLFRIIGHTDATGDPAYNQRLSVRRAEEVRRFFMDDCGIAAGRLEAIGVGKQFPANAADPFAGENRRVEFQAMS